MRGEDGRDDLRGGPGELFVSAPPPSPAIQNPHKGLGVVGLGEGAGVPYKKALSPLPQIPKFFCREYDRMVIEEVGDGSPQVSGSGPLAHI